MSNETDKPLAGALRAARAIEDCADNCLDCFESFGPKWTPVLRIDVVAAVIARESGLAELVEAVERAQMQVSYVHDLSAIALPPDLWNRIVAAARRVRGG